MAQIKYRVSYLAARNRWELTDYFASYDKMQEWRRDKEREAFKQGRKGFTSTVLFERG